MAFGCADPEEIASYKKRIAELEARVKALEGAGKVQVPDWVSKGSRKDGTLLFGVGSVKGIRNASLARSTADNRARSELVKFMGKAPSAVLSGVEIIDHWIHPDGTLYALARLDLSKKP